MSDHKPRPATAEEAKRITTAGFKLGSPEGWWVPAKGTGDPRTTDEMLQALAVFPDATAGQKPGGKSSEFWQSMLIVAPCVGVGITAMTVKMDALPSPWNILAGGILAGIGGTMGALYLRARTMLKAGDG
jgi:hypothetical protein